MSPIRPILFSLCLLPVTVSASIAPSEQLDAKRDQFLTLYQATQQPDEKQLSALKDYPLYPYLEYRLLRNDLPTASAKEVNDFLTSYEDTPLYGRLIFAWAKQQGKADNWTDFIPAWEAISRPDTELKCLHANYLLDSMQNLQAWNEIRPLWRVGYSQPDVCDRAFDAWLKSDNFRSDDALERYLAALENGRPALANYVDDFLRKDAHKKTAQLAKQIYDTPEKLAEDKNLISKQQAEAPRLLELGVRRLARKDLPGSITLWLRDRDRHPLPSEQANQLTEYLGVWLAKRFPEGDERKLLAKLDPKGELANLQGWRIRLNMADSEWKQVRKGIQALPDEERNSDRWRYWLAIADGNLGKKSLTDSLPELARERSFYGFMAAQILNQPYELNDTPHSPSDTELAEIASLPAFQRISELLNFELYADARSEWNLAIRELDTDQIMSASHLMQRWGWHHQGIRGAISSKRWDDMTLRFPNPYPDLFLRHANAQSIDPYWALAVTRQESAFWMGAESRVGARGLMQLMPATAKAVARRHGVSLGSTASLSKPDLNIHLGTAYLGEMIQRFNGNQAYASAAYNAGPGRVNQWLKSRGDLPLDVWIETIPYDETRQYVQNVLSFRVIYRQQDKQKVALFSQQEFSQLALNQ